MKVVTANTATPRASRIRCDTIRPKNSSRPNLTEVNRRSWRSRVARKKSHLWSKPAATIERSASSISRKRPMPLPPVSLRQASPRWSDSVSSMVKVPDSFFISAVALSANRKKMGPSPLLLPLMTTPSSSEAALAAVWRLSTWASTCRAFSSVKEPIKASTCSGALRQGGNGRRLRLLLGLWGLGFRHLLRPDGGCGQAKGQQKQND